MAIAAGLWLAFVALGIAGGLLGFWPAALGGALLASAVAFWAGAAIERR